MVLTYFSLIHGEVYVMAISFETANEKYKMIKNDFWVKLMVCITLAGQKWRIVIIYSLKI